MKSKDKKKVIISSYDDRGNPYYAGGGSCSIHEIAKRLANVFDITVYTGNYSGAKNEIFDGVKYKRLGFSFLGPKLGQLLWHLTLPFMVMRSDFDVWIESFTPPFSTSFTPLFTKKIVIGLVHMLSAEDMERKYKLPFSIVENIGLKLYKYIFAVTENTKEKIKQINENVCVYVIANGVDFPKIQREKKEYILYLGRIEMDQKGLDLLLRAYKKIAHKTGKTLLIAGAGTVKDVALLKKSIAENKLGNFVKYIGKVGGKRKDEVFRKAFFLVLPSRYETFSLVCLEAFSYSIPVVCFDIDGLAWIDSSYAIKIKPFDENSLAEQILFLQKNRGRRLSMGKKGRELAKAYSWEKVALKYKKVLDHIISQDINLESEESSTKTLLSAN